MLRICIIILIIRIINSSQSSGGYLSGATNSRNNNQQEDETTDKDRRFFVKDDVKRYRQSQTRNKPVGSNRITGEAYGSSDNIERRGWMSYLPRINLILDPAINFKLKQRFSFLGACTTLGLDYLTDLSQWRVHCVVEDALLGGRFSLRGNELGWAKAWYMNLEALQGLGIGIDNKAKVKVRFGLNMQDWQAYIRIRYRSEPINSFNIAEGLTLFGKLPLMKNLPLRVEYRSRLHIPKLKSVYERRSLGSMVSLSTGLDQVDISLEELNFCLEWDEKAPVWGIGIARPDNAFRRFRRRLVEQQLYQQHTRPPPPPARNPGPSSSSGYPIHWPAFSPV